VVDVLRRKVEGEVTVASVKGRKRKYTAQKVVTRTKDGSENHD
jgi:hypothetical protein